MFLYKRLIGRTGESRWYGCVREGIRCACERVCISVRRCAVRIPIAFGVLPLHVLHLVIDETKRVVLYLR